MSILIKGMEMPEDRPLIIKISQDGTVYMSQGIYGIGHGVATAVPIPPHGRLGDLDALIEKAIAKYLEHERKGELVFAAAEIKQDIADLISDAPTVLEAE